MQCHCDWLHSGRARHGIRLALARTHSRYDLFAFLNFNTLVPAQLIAVSFDRLAVRSSSPLFLMAMSIGFFALFFGGSASLASRRY